MPSIVFLGSSSNDEPIELDLTKATKKDVYDAFKQSCKKSQKNQKNKGKLIFPFSCKNFSFILKKINAVMNGRKSQVKPEDLIVNELIEALESGNTKLWRKEWTIKGGFRNVLSGHEYKGSNPALLCLQSSIRGWHLPLLLEQVKLSLLTAYQKRVQNLLGFYNHF